ncbi:DNA polymerase [Streptococcus phage C1]|uniref:DNA-directed DNA polymerase n=1 Tax=Streptococcus phage C1 TaxID=2907838 RepID=Q7Y3F5_BPSC1|nr:DNA polymerase [Streptococcus phage C1]AAP42306.1 DNA polymerase [Streptococcus phage C1]
MKEFEQYLKSFKGQKVTSVDLYCDIETATINKNSGQKHASTYHSFTYSLAVSYFKTGEEFPSVVVFNHFKQLFDFIEKSKIRKSIEFRLIFHNGAKYDNHFMVSEIQRDIDNVRLFNQTIKQVNHITDLDLSKKQGKQMRNDVNMVLERRVRSSNNLDGDMWIYGRHYEMVDSYRKTNVSIELCGRMLLNNGLIDEQYLKTDFEYDKYDLDTDLTWHEVRKYREFIFNDLDEKQMKYIHNDVIILALTCKHYSKLFYGFDFEKQTFTQNIKEEYANYNDMAKFQLLKQIGDNMTGKHLKLTDYFIQGQNAYDYFKNYYNGGLNLYNDKYIGKKLVRDGFSIDLNSSYPTVMYKEKLPTFLVMVDSKPTDLKNIGSTDGDYMVFFNMLMEDVNDQILSRIKSNVIKSAIVKYWRVKDGYVWLNNVMISLIEEITHQKFNNLHVQSFSVFECHHFGARDIIAKNYFIKTQGKMSKALNCTMETIDPLNIELTDKDKPKEYDFSHEMVEGSKVLLNGIYGIPALRAYFDCYRRDENGQLYNVSNGFENKERNIVFSAGVTAFAVRNLLLPLGKLTQDEIDDYFWYADTDSLYMDKRALPKLPKSMFHKMNLGGWDIEHANISTFYAFNHKKYCLYDDDDNEIVVRCGGISKALIKKWIAESRNNIDYFINNFFIDGVTIPATRAIRNEWNTITIYDGTSELKKGGVYYKKYDTNLLQNIESELAKLKDAILTEESETSLDYSETMYIESNVGSFGVSDLYKIKKNNTLKQSSMIVDEYDVFKSYLIY